MRIFLVCGQGTCVKTVKHRAKELTMDKKTRIIVAGICSTENIGWLGKKAQYFSDPNKLMEHILESARKNQRPIIDLEFTDKNLAIDLYTFGLQHGIETWNGAEQVLIQGLKYKECLPYNIRQTIDAIISSGKDYAYPIELIKFAGYSQPVLEIIIKQGIEKKIFHEEPDGKIRLTDVAKTFFTL